MFTHLHPATVHFPIALLLLAACAGLLYLYWQRHDVLRTLTWWPLFLGWLGNSIAIITGLFAQSGLPPTAPYRTILNWHITTGLALWVVAGLLLYRQWLQSKAGKRSRKRPSEIVSADNLLDEAKARGWVTVAFLLLIGLLIASGWNGGQLVYDWGVNVTLSMAPIIQIYTFGTLQVVREQQTVTEGDWHTRQARQLLKILITERPRPVANDRLIDLLWPNSAPDAAATTLRSAINALRNVLEPDRPSRAPSKYIITKTPGYAFANHDDIWLDVDHFELALNQAERITDPLEQHKHLEEAIALYEDDYLTSDPYADWAQNERERLRERYFAALLSVANLQAKQHNYTGAIAACRRIIARDPVRENAYQALMRYQAESGDSASALMTYERCRSLLAEELGADPSPLTQAWHQQILNGEIGPQQIRAQVSSTAAANSSRPESTTKKTLILPPQSLAVGSTFQTLFDQEEVATVNSVGDKVLPHERIFVGRTSELSLLQTRLAQVQQGIGSLVLLEGEAGVGKTHLVYHLLRQEVGLERTVIHTTCQPLEQQLPFAALSDGLGRYLHTLPQQSLHALPSTSMAQLAQLVPSLQDRLPDLPVLPMEIIANSDENRQRLINGLISLLTALAEARPLFFFFDDVQWADTETLALLGRLAQRLNQLPIFLLLAYRSGEIAENQALETLIHTLRRHDPNVTHHIMRFTQAEVTMLVEALLGQSVHEEASQLEWLVSRLYETTQGNPLFLIEALRALIERRIGADGNSWDELWSGVEREIQVDGEEPYAGSLNHSKPSHGPATEDHRERFQFERKIDLVHNQRVQEIILERLRRLPTPARNLLHLCAVIGRDFSLDLLEQIATADPAGDVVTDLEILLHRKFLVERTDERIDFSHQVVRQVAYEHMSVLQRRRLHLRVADALAASVRAMEMPGEIAFHYRQSGRSMDHRVAQYLVLAGERLLHSYGFLQAVDCFQDALRLLTESNLALPEWKTKALLGLGLAYESLFDPVGVTETYRQLQRVARAQGDRRLLLTAYSHQTSMLGLLGQQRESNTILLELLDAFASTSFGEEPSTAEGAVVMRDLFRRRQLIYRPDNDPEHGDPEHSEWRAYQLPAPAVHEPVAAIVGMLEPVHAVLPLFEYGWVLLVQGQLTVAVPCLEAAVELARETGQLSIAGICSHLLAVAARIRGELEECYRLNEQSLALNRRLAGRAGELVSMWPRIGSGFAALQLGNLDEAQGRFQRVVTFVEHLGAFRNHYNSATIGLGLVALARGEADEAQSLLQQAIGDYGNLYPYTHTQALLGLAHLAHQHDDSTTCRSYLQRALAFAGERSLLEEYIEALLVIIHLMPEAAPTAVLLSDMLTHVRQLGLTAFAQRLETAQGTLH